MPAGCSGGSGGGGPEEKKNNVLVYYPLYLLYAQLTHMEIDLKCS